MKPRVFANAFLLLATVLVVSNVNPSPAFGNSESLPLDPGIIPELVEKNLHPSPAHTPTLDPATIPKYVEPLVIPPVLAPVSRSPVLTQYEIAVKQFEQQVLPTGFPMTTVWGYGDAGGPEPGRPGSTYNWPGFTVEALVNERVRVKWINGLVDENGDFLPHLLPVDPSLHWANPPGPRDMRPEFEDTPGPYTGPVPIVTHVHGAHVPDISDGYPEAWWLPDARNIPDGYFTRGSTYGSVLPAGPGAAFFEYTNDQRATTLWYHDHALGITRLNVYAGLAGFWLLRDDTEAALDLPGPAPRLGDPPGTRYYEIPIVIQDRSFNDDGSLFYPDSREFFDEFEGPFIPNTIISPIWNPEFFGNAMTVNGKTWPYLEVEPRLYRFRFLNGCNSRFLILKFDRQGLTFHQIGSDGGLLPDAPVQLEQLLMAPAERADVIVDFSQFNPGDEIILLNRGPDEPFGGLPVEAEVRADPETTGQVMKFKVVALTDEGNPGRIPETLPSITALGPADNTRDVTLNEEEFADAEIPSSAVLGTGADGPLTWGAPITENPRLGDTEVWRIINLTEDSHPIHLHLVMFQVLDRTPFDEAAYRQAQEAFINGGKVGTPPDPFAFATGAPIMPRLWENGWKDTVIANPGEVTRIKAMFDLPGLYVWHCHILEHEDNEMMRPYRVVDSECATFDSATATLHIPHLDLGTHYWLDLKLTGVDPVALELEDFEARTSSGVESAVFDLLNATLHVPCLDLDGSRYRLDLPLTGADPLTFGLGAFGTVE